jgi:kynurenine aminotransferase
MIYEGKEHIRFAALPGMWDRTVTIGSAGKSLATAGWQIGWLIGPNWIVDRILAVSTRVTFCTNTPFQEATAAGFEQAREQGYFEDQLEQYSQGRAILARAFDKIGLRFIMPEGGFFMLVDISRVQLPENLALPDNLRNERRDFQVCWFLATEIGVSSLPISQLYAKERAGIGGLFLRFSFGRNAATLRLSEKRLEALKKYVI